MRRNKATQGLCAVLLTLLLALTRAHVEAAGEDDPHTVATLDGALKIPRHAELVLANSHALKYARHMNEQALKGNTQPQVRNSGVQLFGDGQAQANTEDKAKTLLDQLEDTAYNISEPCLNHTKILLEALSNREYWALQVIDSMGKPASGLLEGHLVWLGNWKQCIGIQPVKYSAQGAQKLFTTKYCLSGFKVNTQASPELALIGAAELSIGMCFPESCSTWDAMQLGQLLIGLLPINITQNKPPSMTCQENKLELTDNAVGVIVVCSLFVFVMVLGTAYDLLIVFYLNKHPTGYDKLPTTTRQNGYSDSKPSNGHAVPNGYGAAANETEAGENTSLLNNSYKQGIISHHSNDLEKLKVTNQPNTALYKPGTLGNLVLAFSVYTNAQKIMSTTQPAGTLTSVNGIRFISMTWVILGHTYAFGINVIDNAATFFYEVASRFTFQAISNATFSVDTFFVLSGLLVSYLSLKEMKKRDGARKFNWFMYYFHRYWRLTPPYMLVLMFYVTLMRYWSDGPIWVQNGTDVNSCKDTWWTNMLYLNNVVKANEMCMGWAWYLANDMQFYVISPVMLIPLYYSKLWGSVSCLALVLINFIVSGVISKHHHLNANMILGNNEGDSFDLLYIKPWCRVGPYVVGFFTGYVLYKTNCKVKIPKVVNLVCWCVATAVAIMILYGLYTDGTEPKLGENASALYNATSRTAWGMCVAWVIFSCATGYGGPVNALLSWPAIIPFSRLTYCAYLVHPVVMYTYYFSRRTLMHWYDLDVSYLFLGNLCVSYAVAFVVSLAFESPMMGLEKVLLGRSKNS